jgi:CubicO group peptidase (beta-lactamase class C family)
MLMGCVGTSGRTSQSSPMVPNIDGIEEQMNKALADGKLPALGVRVQKGAELLYFGVQGRRSLQNVANAALEDKWHIGSDTKAMTAYMIALAVQEGKLSYDSKVAQFLKSNAQIHALNRNLTIADILSHGSGLKDVLEVKNGELWKTLSTSTKSLRAQRLDMVAGSLEESPHRSAQNPSSAERSFRYANINYIMAGAILESIYNQEWEQLIKQQLFKPLQMNSCGFGVAGESNETEPSEPWPHVLEGGQLIGVQPKHKIDNPPFVGPAGTVHCSLEDWQKFINELVEVWRGKGKLLVSRETVDRYFKNPPDNPYALGGWGRNDNTYGTPVFQHDGSNTFNYAVALFAPEMGVSILLVTNSGQPEAAKAMTNLKQFIAKEVLDRRQ